MWSAVVLAAGKGTRMGSDLPKVMHLLAGRPLVAYPIETAVEAGVERIVVVTGYKEDFVRDGIRKLAIGPAELRFAHQSEQLGTGHAVACALADLPQAGPVIVLSGDVPGIKVSTLDALRDLATAHPPGLAFASFHAIDPTGYGRVLRDEANNVLAIREQKDASEAERGITECNAGIYCIDAAWLRAVLPSLGRDNAQGEVYLTDLVARAASEGLAHAYVIDEHEAAGVNTPEQLVALETTLG